MMADIARAVLVGRLTRDPELNETGRVLKLGLAVNYRVKSGDEWADEVSFFDVKVLGNRAQGLAKFLVKGRQVAVDARIVQERWEKDGQGRSAVRFIADEVMPIGPREDSSQQPGSASDGQDSVPVGVADDDTIPF